MKKQIIKCSIVKWSCWELNGELSSAIAVLNNLITENPYHFNFRISINSESGYYGYHDAYVQVDADRWETDKELTDRIAVEKDKKKANELKTKRNEESKQKRERTLYESLKRKFEHETNK